MRLSLMKGAHADLSSAAWQEIGVKPAFGLSGIPQRWPRLLSWWRLLWSRRHDGIAGTPAPLWVARQQPLMNEG
jgi:hypothetical protein